LFLSQKVIAKESCSKKEKENVENKPGYNLIQEKNLCFVFKVVNFLSNLCYVVNKNK
jgi:hypothetical protein